MKQLKLVCRKHGYQLRRLSFDDYYCVSCYDLVQNHVALDAEEMLEIKRLSVAIELSLLYGMDNVAFSEIFNRFLFDKDIVAEHSTFIDSIVDHHGPHVAIGWQLFEIAYKFSYFTEHDFYNIANLYFFIEKRIATATKK